MIPAILAKIGIPALVGIIGDAIKDIDNPVAKSTAEALSKFDQALSPEQIAEANRHVEEMAQLRAEEYKTAMHEVNESLRAEIASSDAYVRRMRPTFGYLMAGTWGAQMFAIAYVIVFKTGEAHAVIEAMASLGTTWAVGLSVLGIYVYKRSEDKKLRG